MTIKGLGFECNFTEIATSNFEAEFEHVDSVDYWTSADIMDTCSDHALPLMKSISVPYV
jgi:hypothetical protein